MVDAKFFKGSHRTLNETSIIRSIFRFSFSAALTFPFILISWIELNVGEKLVSRVMIFYVVPSFFVTFLYFAFSRLLFKKLNLVTSDVIDVKSGKLYVSVMDGADEALIQRVRELPEDRINGTHYNE